MDRLNSPMNKRKQSAVDSPMSLFGHTFSQQVAKLHKRGINGTEEYGNIFQNNFSADESSSGINESGYKSVSPIHLLGHKFVPYQDPYKIPSAIEEYEKKFKTTDLKEAAANFILNPHEENVFHPNFDYFEERLIKEDNLLSLRQFIRQSLDNELQSSSRIQILGEANQSPITKISEFNRCVSPDIFEDCEELENQNDAEVDEIAFSCATMQKVMEEDITGACKVEDKDPSTSDRSKELIKKIENLILSLLEKMAAGEPVELLIRNTKIKDNCSLVDNVLTLKPTGESTEKRISSSNNGTRTRFSQILHILQEIYHLLTIGSSCTLRELYYRDPELFETQINVIASVQDICCLLEASPMELGVLSSSKGLIAGNIQITLADDSVIDCSRYSGGVLIPQETSGIKKLETTAQLLLVVEKHTVFERLLERNILTILGYDLILITGKGFPDINTRVMVKKILNSLKLPVYCLVDADPFGIEILMVYRYGSRAMSYNSDLLACPKVHWIGVHPSEIELLAIPSIPLSALDKKRITDLLERTYLSDHIRNELLILQRVGQKAEIESIANFSLNYLTADYIPKISSKVVQFLKIQNLFVDCLQNLGL